VTKVRDVAGELGVAETCDALGLPRATYYRRRHGARPTADRRAPPRRLPDGERQAVLAVLHEERFMDAAPPQVHAQLLDEGKYLCSIRTMYRILDENAESRERRNQLRRPSYEKPQLMASKPNELWSWDITKLLGPQKWTYYYLYVLLDVFSRYAVGWLLADCESGSLAKKLIEESCERQGIAPGQLTVHSDRGGPMTSKTLAQLYADLGVTKTHSRPHTSNDNPFSEAQFKTLKYRPEFPRRFESQRQARDCSAQLIDWYNLDHRHSSLAMLTPHDVHYGLADERLAERASILEAAYKANPERFVHGVPRPQALPPAVWINPPAEMNEAEPEGPAPSASSSARRSGCSSAEPYPPGEHQHAMRPSPTRKGESRSDPAAQPVHPFCPQSAKPRGLGQSPNQEGRAPLAVLQ
jgi:putative transposase